MKPQSMNNQFRIIRRSLYSSLMTADFCFRFCFRNSLYSGFWPRFHSRNSMYSGLRPRFNSRNSLNSGFLCYLIILFFLTSCSSLYLNQRARDTVDIFTFEFQTESYGAAIRTGPVKLGLHQKSKTGFAAGLRGGTFDSFDDQEFSLLFLGSDQFLDVKSNIDTNQNSTTELDQLTQKKQEIIDSIPSLIKLRKKSFEARSPFGTQVSFHKAKPILKESKTKNRFAPAHHFTAIEATVGIYFGLKVGFNIGELIDWCAGWVGFDLFSDDLPVNLDDLIQQINKIEKIEANPEINK